MTRPRRDPELVEALDIATGIVGFFTVVLLVATAVLELRGDDALGWALTLLGLVVLQAGIVWARRKVAAIYRRRQQVSTRS